MKLKFGIKEVVAIGIGTALFIVLTNVQVPFGIIPNTALQSRVAVLTFLGSIRTYRRRSHRPDRPCSG